ncbi:hypothetical protein ACO0RG_002586 [Hanseniaspora osmophila]
MKNNRITKRKHDAQLFDNNDCVIKYISLFNDEVKNALFAPAFKNDLQTSNIHLDSVIAQLETSNFNAGDFTDEENANYTNFLADKNVGSGGGGNGGGGGSCSDSDSLSSDTEEEDLESEDHSVQYSFENDTTIFSTNEEIGIPWSDVEKQVFFHCLSRYSIHLVDEWALQIPSKTKYEIVMYYDILRNNYDSMRNKAMNRSLIKRADLPIAYEMDQEWCEIEETLAQCVSTALFLGNDSGSNESDNTDNNDGDSDSDNNNRLFELDQKWQERWLQIYSKHGLMEYYPVSKNCLPLDNVDTLQYLESCVKSFCSHLIKETILNMDAYEDDFEVVKNPVNMDFTTNGDMVVLQRGSFAEKSGKPRLLLTVTVADIHKAIVKMKQNTRKYGHHPYTLFEQVYDTLKKYNIRLDSARKNAQLKIDMNYTKEGQDESNENKNFPSKEYITDETVDKDYSLLKYKKSNIGQIPALVHKTINDQISLDSLSGNVKNTTTETSTTSKETSTTPKETSTISSATPKETSTISSATSKKTSNAATDTFTNNTKSNITLPQYNIPQRFQSLASPNDMSNSNSNSNITNIGFTPGSGDFPRSAEYKDLLKEQKLDHNDITKSQNYQHALLAYFASDYVDNTKI